jgi:hypothetical protein
VVKLRIEPVINVYVAGFASRREFCGHVIGVHSGLKILQVARSASRRESDELSDRGALVAHIALHRCVRADQRKSVEVILNRLHRNIPAQRRVTLCAVRAKLALVNVRVAIRAILAHIREYRFRMAFRAINFFMHSAQWIARGVMIKFWDGANGGPTRSGVTILARNCQCTVRAAARLSLSINRPNERQRQDYKKRQPTDEVDYSGNVASKRFRVNSILGTGELLRKRNA